MSWLPKQSVVVPIDFCEASLGAIATAIELAGGSENVHVVHVLVPLDGLSPGVVWGEVNDETREHAVRETFAEYCGEHGLGGLNLDVKVGDPGTQITEYSQGLGADLIVIPSHGYGGVARLVLGSVAERVLRHAECPVLVLRRDKKDF